jgi:hypothetical protein
MAQKTHTGFGALSGCVVDIVEDEKTPVRNTAGVGILDLNRPAIENFITITQYVQNLPVGTKVEMLMTLKAFISAELAGTPVFMQR